MNAGQAVLDRSPLTVDLIGPSGSSALAIGIANVPDSNVAPTTALAMAIDADVRVLTRSSSSVVYGHVNPQESGRHILFYVTELDVLAVEGAAARHHHVVGGEGWRS
jgi:hypothetical protein